MANVHAPPNKNSEYFNSLHFAIHSTKHSVRLFFGDSLGGWPRPPTISQAYSIFYLLLEDFSFLSLPFYVFIITYYAMFVNIFFASFLFLLLASRFVKRKSPCLLNVRYFLLLVFIITTSFPLSCIYYIILLRICQ